jgi:hypothetical protein
MRLQHIPSETDVGFSAKLCFPLMCELLHPKTTQNHRIPHTPYIKHNYDNLHNSDYANCTAEILLEKDIHNLRIKSVRLQIVNLLLHGKNKNKNRTVSYKNKTIFPNGIGIKDYSSAMRNKSLVFT